MGSVIIIILIIGIIFIVRLKKIYKLLKNPLIQKGVIYHLVCFIVVSAVHIPEPTRSSLEKEREIERAVTIQYLEENMKEHEYRFGDVDEVNYAIYRDDFLDYDERQELYSQIEKEIDKMYDSNALPAFVYDISKVLTYVLVALWIILSLVLNPMRKTLVLAISVISLGLLFSNLGRDGIEGVTEDSVNLKEDTNNTFVDPHYVNSYEKQDGNHITGYWRDGDGDTTTNLSSKEGGGYWRSHPDGNSDNNLKS